MLLQNQTLFAQYPVKQNGGAVAQSRSLWGRGDRINQFTQIDKRGGTPNGHLAPSSWVLPMKAGAGSSYTGNEAVGAGTATGTIGLTSTMTGGGIGAGVASGSAVASSTMTGGGVGAGTATGVGLAFGAATGAAVAAGTAQAGALATSPATGAATGVGVAQPGALAWGAIVPTLTEISPDAVATAVWNATAAGFTGPGTFGKEVQDAKKAARLAAALSA